jgi:hypothetical protein
MVEKVVLLALPMFLLLSLPVVAGTVQLPMTGQTVCYDSSGAAIPCAGTGQDGDKRAGVPWPSPRFVVNGDCVADNLTGLTWAHSGNLGGVTVSWQGALDSVAALNSGSGLCGYHDWRLPNVNELESMVGVAQSNGADWLNGQGFTAVQAGTYWSSTTYANDSTSAWNVFMAVGGVGKNSKSITYYVWPVRSGQ